MFPLLFRFLASAINIICIVVGIIGKVGALSTAPERWKDLEYYQVLPTY